MYTNFVDCEPPTKEASMLHRSSIAVHRSSANPHIGGVTSPKCVFTLHIGTLVLSDEAVLNARDKSLLLTWKFYDQNVAMTGMRAGRVVLFDFSTQYDMKIDDNFLDYLKNGEMPIVICEPNKQDEPFASCVLPFRETLLNTNRRVDMSLALTTGPGMSHLHGATDALDTGYEVGVLDLWCMLRVSSTFIPAINRCIALPFYDQARGSIVAKEKPTKLIPPVVEDDQLSVYRLYEHELLKKPKSGDSEHRPSKSLDYDLFGEMRRRLHSSQNMDPTKEAVTILPTYSESSTEQPQKDTPLDVLTAEDHLHTTVDVTVLWLSLNEQCEAMADPRVHQLYVAYNFLGRSGADMETPYSLPKPKSYGDKCIFNFKKSFHLHPHELPLLGHMARCREAEYGRDPRDCIIFTVISEPPDDPLGLLNCEDIGNAYLYLGDILAYSPAGSDSYTEVIPVRSTQLEHTVCGVLAVKIDGLEVVRKSALGTHTHQDN